MYQGLHMDIFIREFKSLLTSLVVKRNVLAKAGETLDILREAEMFVMVKDGIDDFFSYNNFDYEVYRRAGVSETNIYKYKLDKNTIPYGLRTSLIKLQRERILSNYVEKNNYYRMLNGLPDVEDIDFIYAPENVYGVLTTVPVHQLGLNAIERLRSAGILAKLIEANPTKEYLNHMGSYSIDVYTARKAQNYDLLYCDTTDPSNIALNFKKFYANAREYYMNAIYNVNTAASYEYYDNFIGFCILIMAVQRLFASVFEQGITRDFYDVQLVRYLFDSYSIPFIEDMTLDQMKLLAKNLNIFLAYKSSNRVIFDLCSIFGFTNVKIYKYLLVRDHVRSSETGKPIFPTKTISNGDGTFSTVTDYEKMYDIYFQKVDVHSKDVHAALVDKANAVTYETLTVGDIYWIDDEKLRERLYTAGMNHIESKYLSMDILFKITEMMYEICHTFRMIIDNNEEFKKVFLMIPKVSSRPHDLYSIVIFICAMFCKRYGFTGEIPLKPASIAYVYGFNFHTDLDMIVNDVLESKYIDDDVIKYLLNFQVNSNKDVDRIYHNIKTFKDFIVEQMASTKDIEVYRAYKSLYKSVLVVEDKHEMYAKTDGTLAATYFDLLQSVDPELYIYLDEFDTSDAKTTESVMQHVLYRMETLCSEFKYLHMAVDASALIQVLIRLINFFKSYTVDLTHSGILYLLDDRFFNMIKILDKIHAIDAKMWQDDSFLNEYSDMISRIDIKFPEGGRIKFTEDLFMEVRALILDKLFLGDNLFTSVWNPVESRFLGEYSDTMDLELRFPDGEHIKFVAELSDMIIRLLLEDKISIKEDLSELIESNLRTDLLGQYADNMTILATLPEYSRLTFLDKLVEMVCRHLMESALKLREDLSSQVTTKVASEIIFNTADSLTLDMDIGQSERIQIRDKIVELIVKFLFHTKISLEEDLTNELMSPVSTSILGKYAEGIYPLVKYSDEESMKLLIDELAQIRVEKESKYELDDKVEIDTLLEAKEDIPLSSYAIIEVRNHINNRVKMLYKIHHITMEMISKTNLPLSEILVTQILLTKKDSFERLTDGVRFSVTDSKSSSTIMRDDVKIITSEA